MKNLKNVKVYYGKVWEIIFRENKGVLTYFDTELRVFFSNAKYAYTHAKNLISNIFIPFISFRNNVLGNLAL